MTRKDITPYFSVGFPLISLVIFVIIAMIDAEYYYRWISISEKGYLEHSTVVMLVIAIFLLVWMLYHHTDIPNKGVKKWTLLLLLGCIYFAGEEASWGQHYLGWNTPEWLDEFNDQGETNIHNAHGIFDQFPRFLLTLASVITIIAAPILVSSRREWGLMQKWQDWIFPTMASVTAALGAALVGLPQKFYGYYGPKEDHIPAWFDVMFLRGQHSELKEHYFAMFMMMYVISLAYRFWCYRSEPHRQVEESQG